MAGTNILVRQKDLIAGTGISITPDTTSGNVTIAATNASIDESRLVPTGGKSGDILSYQEGVDQGNGDNVRLLLQNALTDSANGNAAPAAVTTQGVTLTGDNNLLFDGNDSHVTAVLATDEIFAADKEWTIDFWMKPTANSSEWNYILTENTGDWGSHSIGLTWNSDDSTLEQDTGGYLASVIRSSNWPNDAVACAADQWHFVAVEKQKTSTGWSLNYYLNGAIWLQVAFTGEFVPFDSSNPFWFGGKTTDSGRWFKGEANKLRVTTGARYGGKAFAVPDRLTDYAAPAGQPVWTEGIDRSRLLPEDPANGDIPCFDATATIGGGNDANTRLLLQPSTSDHGIVDQAAGNAAPVTLENHNVTVDEEGNMVFDGSNAYLKIPANTLPSDFFNGTDEWTLDIVYNVASKGMQCLFGCSSSLRMDFLLDSDGSLQIGAGPNLGTGWPFNEDVHLTFEIYKDGTVWKYTIFRNGSVVTTGTWVNADWRSVAQYVGWEGESDSRKINGKIKALRLTSGALHKGAAFQSDYPWTRPQTVGEWSKFNKSKLVQSINGQTPDADGNINLTEISEDDFSGIGYNKVPKQKPEGLILPNEFKRLKFEFSNNIPLASISAENCFPFIMANATDSDEYMAICPADPAQPNWFTFRTDGFMIKLIKLNVRIDKGSVDVVFDYELYGSLDAAAVYDGISEGWDLLHSGEAYIIAQSDNTKKLIIEIPEASRKYYRSYTFKMSSVSGPGIIEWSPQYMLHGWGSASPVESVNGQTPDSSGAVTLPEATTSAAGLMSATDREKSIGLTTRGFYPNALAKSGAVDFNEVIDHGFYFIGGDTPHLNYPETYQQTGGTLQVIRNGNYLTQTLILFEKNKSFNRSCFNAISGSSERKFSAWQRLLTDADITESKTSSGYFKLPCGTIVQWGKKTAITRDEENCYISFPIAFPTVFLSATAIASSGTLSATGVIVSLSEASTTSMTMVVKNHPNTGSPDMDQYIEMYWFAVGF